MLFDPQFAYDTMLPLAEAAYDLTLIPAPWKLVAAIQPGDFGFIAVAGNIIVIAFHGTETKGEWLEDFEGVAVPNRFGKGMVHQGFQDQYAAVRPSILFALAQVSLSEASLLRAPDQIWITGHSLGASLATLCASDTAIAGGRANLTYTFAGPRVGWHDYSGWFKQWWGPIFRIVNEWDVVWHTPTALMGYEHVGSEVLIDGGRPKMDGEFLRHAHNLQLSYRPGLAKLLPLPKVIV
jgi:predicted lipase